MSRLTAVNADKQSFVDTRIVHKHLNEKGFIFQNIEIHDFLYSFDLHASSKA